MATKRDEKPAKSGEKPLEKKAETAAAPSPEEYEHVPAEAENFEHTLKRLITERDEKRAANAGIYR